MNNTLLNILVLLVIFIYFKTCFKGLKKYLFIILISIIPILCISYNICMFSLNFTLKLNFIIDILKVIFSIKIIFIIYWLLITILLLYIAFNYYRKNSNFKCFFFITIGIIANLSMLLSPISGGRTNLFTIIIMSIGCLIYIDNYVQLNRFKMLNICFYTIFIMYVIILLILYNSVRLQNINRKLDIQRQINSNNDIIEIERFPDNILWNLNAWNQFHENQFKIYYSIPNKKVIVRSKVNYKYNLIYWRKK